MKILLSVADHVVRRPGRFISLRGASDLLFNLPRYLLNAQVLLEEL